MENKKTHILLVEDDQVDVANMLRAFKVHGIDNPVHVAHDGATALEILRTGALGMEFPVPKIILLDLKLPGMSGLELLKEIRQNEVLRACSVFVMTTSESEKDVLEAYNLNVAGYILKPINYESFLAMIATLNSYWELIELPH